MLILLIVMTNYSPALLQFAGTYAVAEMFAEMVVIRALHQRTQGGE